MDSYRYLILTEGHLGPHTSKTATSAIRYIPDRVAGVLDSSHAGRTVQDVIGIGGDVPIVGNIEDGLALEATALLIGIAPSGGRLPESWRPLLREAMNAGLHIVSGLHVYLSDDAELSAHATARGVRIHDLRKPPADLSVSRGLARLVQPLVVLTVGTDCNIGKMTSALQLKSSLAARGSRVGFAPTGQTGILIEGWGIAVDAVIADFIAGAAERLTLQAAEGNDVVLVEGQGSLVHPAYSGVTLGLLHGTLPDAMILCHKPSRVHPYGGDDAYSWMELPNMRSTIAGIEAAIRPLRESSVIGISLNTWEMPEADAQASIAQLQRETGLPVTDPVRYDPTPLVDAILAAGESKRARVAGVEAKSGTRPAA